MLIYEAECERCQETFNPTPSVSLKQGLSILTGPVPIVWMDSDGFTSGDLEHGDRANGDPCGGPGELTGAWVDAADR